MSEPLPISTTLPEMAAEAPPRSRPIMLLVTVVAITMSLYHMYVSLVGPPETYFFRGTHLLFALALVFMLYPSARGGGAGHTLDSLLLAASVAIVAYIFINHEYVIFRIIYIDELTLTDKVFAVVAVVTVVPPAMIALTVFHVRVLLVTVVSVSMLAAIGQCRQR